MNPPCIVENCENEPDIEQLAEVHRLMGNALARRPPVFLSAEYDALPDDDVRRSASTVIAALGWWLCERGLGDMVPRRDLEAEVERRLREELVAASHAVAGMYRDPKRWRAAQEAYDRRQREIGRPASRARPGRAA